MKIYDKLIEFDFSKRLKRVVEGFSMQLNYSHTIYHSFN